MTLLGVSGVSLLPSYTVIGLVLGGVYALAAIGLVLIYRVSGVLNFAHGAIAMFSTFIAYQISERMGLPAVLGLAAAIAAGMAIGYMVERLTIRPLQGRPPLTKVVVTIAWLLILQTGAGLIWGNTGYHAPVHLVSKSGFRLVGTSVVIGFDQLTTFVVALVLALATAALLKYTILGTSMRAVADDPDTGKLWGISVNKVTAASWMAGSAMAAIAGVLITPLINFNTYSLTLIVIDAFAAALIGRLTSLPWTVVGAIFLGISQTYPRAFFSNAGIGEVVSFLLVLGTLAILFRPGFSRWRVV
ncbi:MAG: branched-chain amino acid ABC transporter permease [Actinomycetota bacterium]